MRGLGVAVALGMLLAALPHASAGTFGPSCAPQREVGLWCVSVETDVPTFACDPLSNGILTCHLTFVSSTTGSARAGLGGMLTAYHGAWIADPTHAYESRAEAREVCSFTPGEPCTSAREITLTLSVPREILDDQCTLHLHSHTTGYGGPTEYEGDWDDDGPFLTHLRLRVATGGTHFGCGP